jgi:hypothetical protein
MLLRFFPDSLWTRKCKNGEEVPSYARFTTSVERLSQTPPPITQAVFAHFHSENQEVSKHNDTRFDNQLTGSQLSEN